MVSKISALNLVLQFSVLNLVLQYRGTAVVPAAGAGMLVLA
jgi:hypothetical protein